jgi:hypothetical protein
VQGLSEGKIVRNKFEGSISLMKRTIVQLALATALSASFLAAQPTPPTPAQIAANRVARLTTLLDLTTAQQSTATTIFTTAATANQALMTQMQTAQAALKTAVTSNSGITAAAATIGSLTTQQIEADASAEAAFYAILTADQKTKYATLPMGFGGGPGGRGGRGPGGPGGPGR